MKLFIKRGQEEKTDIFGRKVIFSLTCRIEFTPEEEMLISKYKHEEMLSIYLLGEIGSVASKLSDREVDELISKTRRFCNINELVHGVMEESDNFRYLVIIEDALKKACETFIKTLYAMATYGGEETIEI